MGEEFQNAKPDFSQGLSLGRFLLGLPDRGCLERGRQGAVDLGLVLPPPRENRARGERRRRLRSLSPLAGRSRSDKSAWSRGVPVLGLVAEGHSRGQGRGQQARTGFLRPPGGG